MGDLSLTPVQTSSPTTSPPASASGPTVTTGSGPSNQQQQRQMLSGQQANNPELEDLLDAISDKYGVLGLVVTDVD